MYRNYQLPEGKRIRVYRSGDTFYPGKSMVVNPMQIRNMDNLINIVTNKVDPDWGAVRSIHTPNRGTVVETLDGIKRDGIYVAAGTKGFVSIPGGYENIGKLGLKKKFADHKPIHRPGVKPEVYNIQVFKNGEDGVPTPFKFTKSDFNNWTQALYRLSEKVRLPQGPIRRIYNLDGTIVKEPSEIVNNGTYVVAASNETFRNASYGDVSSETVHKTGGGRDSRIRFSKKQKPSGRASKQEDSHLGDSARVPMKIPTKRLTRKPRPDTKEDEDPRRFSSSNGKKLGPGRARANVKRVTKSSGSAEDGSDTEDAKNDRKFSKSKPPSVVSSKLQSRSRPSSRRSSANGSSRGHSSHSKGTTSRHSFRGGTAEEEEEEDDRPSSRLSNASEDYPRVASPVTGDIPHQIPESSDLENIEYLKLRSRQNSPNESPYGTPVNSRPSSPATDYVYLSRTGSVFSLPEPIAEENEDEDMLSTVEEVISESGTTSRTSFIDSGHASLLDDDDRPDSVFRAKTRSRPVTQAREVNYDTDDGGIYRSKSKSDYVRGAKEILDSSVTEIELPIDLMDAKEVQEEILLVA